MNLYDDISSIKGVGEKNVRKFNKTGIYNVGDLLEYSPKKYNVYKIIDINEALDNENITIVGNVCSKVFSKSIRSNIEMIIFSILSSNQTIKVISFGQSFLKYQLKMNDLVTINGTYHKGKKEISLLRLFLGIHDDEIIPDYTIDGLGNSYIRNILKQVIEEDIKVSEFIHKDILRKYNLLDKSAFIKKTHFPSNEEDLRQLIRRKKYEDFFKYSLVLNELKSLVDTNKKTPKASPREFLEKFGEILPFKLTNDQRSAIKDIIEDSNKKTVMNRLIQGDVGSGKTIIAIFAILLNAYLGYQSVLMCPTDVLANQNYVNASYFLSHFGFKTKLLTGKTKAKEKREIEEGIKSGDITLLVSTHAVLYNDLSYKNLGLYVVDEQHRFGVLARKKLLDSNPNTDAIYLSATPIPRTLGLTRFGDMDISTISSKPQGREKIDTKILSFNDFNLILEDIRKRVLRHEQAYLVVAQITEKSMNMKDIDFVTEKLKKDLPEIKFGIIHGKLKQDKKDEVMTLFKNKAFDLLVSTTVIEVGIDVKDASAIYILNAERFGLSTLHQLRGRVGRSNLKSTCFLVSDDVFNKRLKVIEENDDCFKLADEDLKLRGPGELLGEIQSGFSDFDFVGDFNIYECARKDALEYFSFYKSDSYYSKLFEAEISKNIDKILKLN